MRFREHRGTLSDSLRTEVVLNGQAAITACVRSLSGIPPFQDSQLLISSYDPNPDPRTGWSRTDVVTIDGHGVVGFVDGVSS